MLEDPKYGEIQKTWLMLSLAFQTHRWMATVALILLPLGTLLVQLDALWLKLAVDGAVSGDPFRTLLSTGLVAISLGLGVAFLAPAGLYQSKFSQHVTLAAQRRVAELVASLPGIEHHERPDFLDRIELLRQSDGVFGEMPRSLASNITRVLLMGGTIILLASVHPIMLLLPLFAVPTLIATSRGQGRLREAESTTAASFRLSRHMFEVGTQPQSAKEVRVFNSEPELMRRYGESRQQVLQTRLRTEWIVGVWNGLASTASQVGFAFSLVAVVWLATRGRATPGDVLLAMVLVSRINSQVSEAVAIFGSMQQQLRSAERLLWLMEYVNSFSRRADQRAPESLQSGIVMEGVSFKYPGTDRHVLREINLDVPAGSVVALVGENGAGKTTLVKLLLRFYDPTEGRILADGIDLKSVDHTDWRKLCTGEFEDFAKLEFVLRESVGVGYLPDIDKEGPVTAALVRAGAEEISSSLGGRLETQLGRTWEGGVELSMGQWQKVALGRSWMRPGALLAVLDEPTSSLDPQAEYALFQRIAEQSRQYREQGSITVIVSHRFSTVRMADVILVMKDGTIVEWGTHAELMKAGGLYAELFNLQATQYMPTTPLSEREKPTP